MRNIQLQKSDQNTPKKYRIKEKIKKHLVKQREAQQGYIIQEKTNRLLKFGKVKEEKYFYQIKKTRG